MTDTDIDNSTLDNSTDNDDTLTPFPRRNHLNRMRRERNRRRARFGLGATLVMGAVLGTSGVAAGWAAPSDEPKPLVASQASIAQASDELHAEQTAHQSAKETLDEAKTTLDDANDDVDTKDLSTLVGRLADYKSLTPTFTLGLVKQTQEETETVADATAEADQADKEAAEKEAERKAAEEAEKKAQANTPEGAKATAKELAASQYGWGAGEFSCLVSLWNKESGWSYTASNPSSGAYGIPQALPGSKMGSVASDWETNATTQITWGLQYIAGTYGTPCSAWGHSQATGWY